MKKTIGLYVGGDPAPNLVRFLNSLDKIVDQRFALQVIGRDIDPSVLPGRYELVNVGRKNSRRGLDEMRLAYLELRGYLNDASPMAIWQITSPHFHAIPAIVAARRARIPVATRVPGQKFEEYRTVPGPVSKVKTFLMNNCLLRLLRLSNLVVSLSDNNRKNLIRNGIPERKIVVLRPPLDTEEFSPVSGKKKRRIRRDLGINQSASVVLYVGRLSQQKGMETLATVIGASTPQEGLQFHVVGDGPYADKLAGMDSVVLHGVVPPANVHLYYQAADLLIHPSHTEEEGISWTMLEAAAVGLPVAARNIQNAASVASFVFDDAEELIDYVRKPGEWEPAKYPAEWSLDALVDPYTAFFQRLVGNPTTGGLSSGNGGAENT